MLEEAQGLDVQGRSIMVDFVGEKSQKGGKGAGEWTPPRRLKFSKLCF